MKFPRGAGASSGEGVEPTVPEVVTHHVVEVPVVMRLVPPASAPEPAEPFEVRVDKVEFDVQAAERGRHERSFDRAQKPYPRGEDQALEERLQHQPRQEREEA